MKNSILATVLFSVLSFGFAPVPPPRYAWKVGDKVWIRHNGKVYPGEICLLPWVSVNRWSNPQKYAVDVWFFKGDVAHLLWDNGKSFRRR